MDALRGLAMILMAIDHTRDFFHGPAMQGSPENLATTTAAIFLTRWVTHFCAPVFMFLAGVGAYYWGQRAGRTPAALSRYLLTRGLWLIFLDATVVRLGFYFNFFEGGVLFTTLWALGGSMIILAGLSRLRMRIVGPLSLAVIALHNLLDGVTAAQFGPNWGVVWNILHQPGGFTPGGVLVIFAYPLVPWFAVMAAGYWFAPWAARRNICFRAGLALTTAFVVLRFINIYGDPVRWTPGDPTKTILSFLRCTKYPPSLDFLLMTLGPALLLLSVFLRRNQWKAANPLLVFGRTPLFYFLTHLFVIHALAVVAAMVRYGSAGFLFHPIPSMGGTPPGFPPDYGYPLVGVYVAWLAVVLIEYPLCRLFGKLKSRHPENFLLRFL